MSDEDEFDPQRKRKVYGVDWPSEVKAMLKAEIARSGLGYREVVARLNALGIKETEANFRNKLARGTFTAVFFVQVLVAVGADDLRIKGAGPKATKSGGYTMREAGTGKLVFGSDRVADTEDGDGPDYD